MAKKRVLSAEGRARIADAQKKRWDARRAMLEAAEGKVPKPVRTAKKRLKVRQGSTDISIDPVAWRPTSSSPSAHSERPVLRHLRAAIAAMETERAALTVHIDKLRQVLAADVG